MNSQTQPRRVQSPPRFQGQVMQDTYPVGGGYVKGLANRTSIRGKVLNGVPQPVQAPEYRRR